MSEALFVAFEGGEGSGKTTQARLLHQRLTQAGRLAYLFHEPGETPMGERIRELIKAERPGGRHQGAMSPMAELFLFCAARAEFVRSVLGPTLREQHGERRKVVVCDRYVASTLAYQGYGRGIPLERIRLLNRWVTGDIEPDLTVLLDIAPEEGLRRVEAQKLLSLGEEAKATPSRQDAEGSRRFEKEPLAFHRKVRRGYLALARSDPGRWLVVDATLPMERIGEVVWERVTTLLTQR